MRVNQGGTDDSAQPLIRGVQPTGQIQPAAIWFYTA